MNELVNQAKKGDPDAFTELMRSQMQNMYKAARAILNRDTDTGFTSPKVSAGDDPLLCGRI